MNEIRCEHQITVRIKKLCRHVCSVLLGMSDGCQIVAGSRIVILKGERGERGGGEQEEGGGARGARAANHIGPKRNDNKRNNQRNNNNNKTTATLWRAIIFSSSPCLSWLAITCTASLALRSDLSMLYVFSLESTVSSRSTLRPDNHLKYFSLSYVTLSAPLLIVSLMRPLDFCFLEMSCSRLENISQVHRVPCSSS